MIKVIAILVAVVCVHEAIADSRTQFAAYDANKDGKWSRKEADYVITKKNQASILNGRGFSGLDTDNDGAVGLDEYNVSKLKTFLQQAGVPSTFHDVDTDRDGYIMVLEFVQAVHTASKKRIDAIFPVADTTHDGFISQAEFLKSNDLINSICDFPCDEGDA